MYINNIRKLQIEAAAANIELFKFEFEWCHRAVELIVDTHVHLANDPSVLAGRLRQSQVDLEQFEATNTAINLAYDAGGIEISALMLAEYGLMTDSWCLIRVAFESTSYSEYFALNPAKVRDYSSIASLLARERIEEVGGNPFDVASEFAKRSIGVSDVRKALAKANDFSRRDFYARLSTLGTHASPLRPGLRIGIGEPEVRMYLSIGHRELRQCVADLAAVIKYALGIPFEHRSEFLSSSEELLGRYESQLVEYFSIYPPPVVPN